VDVSLPDAPLVKLDQQPFPFELGVDDLPYRDIFGADAGVVPTLTAPFFLDFEQSNGQLAGTRDWEWGQLSFKATKNCDYSTNYYPPKAGHSGNGMWGTKLNDCYSPLENNKDPCNNDDLVDDSVLTVKVMLPANMPNPRLTFWEWGDYFLTFDWSEIRIDGTVVRQVCKDGALSVPPKWAKHNIDLKAYAGQTITITFHFMASGVVNHAGWYIDDLAVNSD
jgi:hypothetical protein